MENRSTNINFRKEMKLILLLIVPLIFIGCSPIYTIKDFSSKEKFYTDFNKSAGNKSVNVAFLNDSSAISNNGAGVENDSLILLRSSFHKGNMTLLLNDIEKINYSGTDFRSPSAHLELKSGETLNAEDIKILKDSIKFSAVIYDNQKIPLANIKSVCYKDRGRSSSYGLVAGVAAAYVLFTYGILPPYKNAGWDSYFNERVVPKILGLLIWPAAGAIVGYLIGRNYTYQFNP